ncbi:glucuronosyltransferase [Altererythrobacter sp.]|uniref:glucuronosyltransferase n=1 Tax=Altererythrobacter sp. TaxID=1872480 RepID=UPI003D05B45D
MAIVLAAASGGGHLEQMALLREAFAPHDWTVATTDTLQAEQLGIEAPAILPDCNLDQPLRSLICAFRALLLILRIRPDIVISTGAAPGFLCIFWGRLLGARTLWIDSVANAEQLSLSGRLARRVAHRCLTQWEHLSDGENVQFAGSVL